MKRNYGKDNEYQRVKGIHGDNGRHGLKTGRDMEEGR